MMKQDEIIFKIHRDINNDLKQVLKGIQDNNDGNEKQFDYVTSPALASAIDETERLLKQIQKIVY